jgi:hypothetical protein
MFQIEAPSGRKENSCWFVSMDQLVNPIEASLVFAVAFVVANDGGQIAGPESVMSHDAAPSSEVPGPLHSAVRKLSWIVPKPTAR